METAEFIAQGIERVRSGTLRVVKDLTPEELAWRPVPEANSAAFLLFHIFRTADAIFARLTADEPQFWDVGNWARRWTLPAPPPDAHAAWSTGNGWTPADLAVFEPPDLDDLLGYGGAVHARGLTLVRAMDPARLEAPVSAARPDVTVASSLLSVITHEAPHGGQIDYLLGLKRTAAAS